MRWGWILALLTLCCCLSAMTIIEDGEEISGIWNIDNSPYHLLGNATILTGEALVIEPGVVVQIAASQSEDQRGAIFVSGTINAVGTSDLPIIFEPFSNFYYWGAIVIEDSFSENNQFIHCAFQQASRTHPGSENLYGAVALYESSAYFEHCEFYDNAFFGVACRENSLATIQDCEIHDNDWSGVYVRDNSEANIYDSNLYSNGDYGLYVREQSLVSVENSEVNSNGQDGVYLREESQLEMTDCDVSDNNHSGIDVVSDAILNLTDCTVNNNYASGLTADYADLDIFNCTFNNNYYGLIFSHNYNPVIESCEMCGNGNDGLRTDFASNAIITDCIISDNGDNGVYSGEDGSPLFLNNEISNNDSYGIETYRSTTMLVNNRIHHNGSSAVYFYRWDDGAAVGNLMYENNENVTPGSYVTGDIVIDHHSYINLTNNSFFSNVQGVYPTPAVYVNENSYVEINNCIMQTAASVSAADTCATVSWSCMTKPLDDAINGEGNLTDTDPCYVDTLEFDFHLAEDSPCINAGSPDVSLFNLPAFDLDGNPRVWDGRIDMGACERYYDIPPTINGWEPTAQDTMVAPGTSIHFVVHAMDWEPISYQWLVNGEDMGENDSLYTHTFNETGFFSVQAIVSDGELESETRWTVQTSVSANDDPQHYPLTLLPGANPTRGAATLRYSLPSRTDVQITIYDIRGRRVRKWRRYGEDEGSHTLVWNGRNAAGAAVGSGVYIVRLSTDRGERCARLTLLH